MSTPHDPSGPPPDHGPQGRGQQPGYPPYPQQQYQGYVAPKPPLDLARLVTIGAWVVLGLFAPNFIYTLTQDDEFGPDVADRFFGSMPTLGQGIFWTGVLLAVGVWLRKQQGPT
jgi:hypothetical protein